MVGQSNQVKGKAAQPPMIQERGHGLLNILLKNLALELTPVVCSMAPSEGFSETGFISREIDFIVHW